MKHLAFALLGWYALVPPVGNLTAPLQQWEHFRSFDTAKECEEMMLEYVRKLPQDGAAAAWYRQAERVRCIDTADPRLRG